jgi:hypothetical protein
MLQDADIRIDLPNWKRGDKPYSVQFGGCGDPGEYIHLTPSYVMNFDSEPNVFKYGPAGCYLFLFFSNLRSYIFIEFKYR